MMAPFFFKKLFLKFKALSMLRMIVFVISFTCLGCLIYFLAREFHTVFNNKNSNSHNRARERYVVITKAKSDFAELAQYFADKKEAQLLSFETSFSEVIPQMKLYNPHYTAIVVPPVEVTPDFLDSIDEQLRNLDSDQYLDTAYGIITAFNPTEGKKYIDRLLNFKPSRETHVYGINLRGQHDRMLKEHTIDTLVKCTFTMEGGMVWCSEDQKVKVSQLAEDLKARNFFIFNLHGDPSTVYLDDGEKITGSQEGLHVFDTAGNSDSLELNDTFIIAESCLTARVNGSPSTIVETGWDDSRPGDINTSFVLSSLKSGAIGYIGAAHYSNMVITPDFTLVPQSILEGISVGEALKNLKNWYLFNIAYASVDREASPKSNEITRQFIEYQLKEWVLFGDPSLVISSERQNIGDCVQSYEETPVIVDSQTQQVKTKKVSIGIKFADEKGTLLGNTSLFSDISKNGQYSSDGCAVIIPLESKLKKYNVTYTGINERYKSYFEGDTSIITDAGGELILVVPNFLIDGDQMVNSASIELTIDFE